MGRIATGEERSAISRQLVTPDVCAQDGRDPLSPPPCSLARVILSHGGGLGRGLTQIRNWTRQNADSHGLKNLFLFRVHPWKSVYHQPLPHHRPFTALRARVRGRLSPPLCVPLAQGEG